MDVSLGRQTHKQLACTLTNTTSTQINYRHLILSIMLTWASSSGPRMGRRGRRTQSRQPVRRPTACAHGDHHSAPPPLVLLLERWRDRCGRGQPTTLVLLEARRFVLVGEVLSSFLARHTLVGFFRPGVCAWSSTGI